MADACCGTDLGAVASDESRVEWKRSVTVRGPKHLPVTL